MTNLQKYRVLKNGIKVALPAAEFCEPDKWSKWKKLPFKEFMEQFGKSELAKYELLTAKEFERMKLLDENGGKSVDSDSDTDDSDSSADYADVKFPDDEDDDNDNDDQFVDVNAADDEESDAVDANAMDADDTNDVGDAVDAGEGGGRDGGNVGKGRTTRSQSRRGGGGTKTSGNKGKAKARNVSLPPIATQPVESLSDSDAYVTGEEGLSERTPRGATFIKGDEDVAMDLSGDSSNAEGSKVEDEEQL